MYKIDLTNINNKREFHQLIKETMDFPEYYGNNLDALYDILTEYSEPLEIEFITPAANLDNEPPGDSPAKSDGDNSEEMAKLIKGLKRLSEDIMDECPNITISFRESDCPSDGAIDRATDSQESNTEGPTIRETDSQESNTEDPTLRETDSPKSNIETPNIRETNFKITNIKVNNMQFRDLKKQYQVLKDDIDAAMIKVATDCNFISGNQVKELEQQLADFVGAKHCVTCANGTDALSIAIMVWGIGPGDAVFVPDFTFFSSGEIVSHCGATPIFVDVDERTFNMDIDSLKHAISKVRADGIYEPKAVVAVDLFGLPADLWKIKEICREEGLYLLEDGAQGFGGAITSNDSDASGATQKRACSFGDISTTSFFPAKPLGCYGDGGALFTDNDEWADLMRSICVHGKGAMKYDNVRIGLNSRLDTLQAGILKVKLQAFDNYELEDVNKAADYYYEAFADCFDSGGEDTLGNSDRDDASVNSTSEDTLVYSTCKGEIKLPLIPDGFYSSWAQFTIQVSDEATRDGLQAALKEAGIPSMIYYIKPMHKQLAFDLPEDYEFPCPVTEQLCKTVLSLPMHPYLSKEDAQFVVSTIKAYMG